MGSKNQDLMEQILIIREQLKTLEEQAADENQKIQRHFTQELSLCYHELQSLVQVCVQRAEGNDPNMSLLLGVRGEWWCTYEIMYFMCTYFSGIQFFVRFGGKARVLI